ncbi:MAG: glycosyltransferase family 2 protein [Candidatus Paceibacterota bacterium]|jgi:cellulose synthase/poly-beta-1,6-N-acetylglucosamine synthase-like glycosyltransferase
MFSIGMAIPYFAQLMSGSRILYFILSVPSSIFSYVVALILGIFFIRLFFYFFWASKKWKHIEKISINDLEKITVATNQKLPFFTIFVPALDESEVIANTILKMAEINYPHNLYQIQIVVDEKERKRAKPDQITTRNVVEQMIEKFKNQFPELKLSFIEVPYDFDGKVGGKCIGQEVPSTKGRGLNYALYSIPLKTDFCAFFDAEASPNSDSFLAVAKAYLLDHKKRIFQLPVYQIRNFWSLSVFCKIAALGQCFSHQYVLPFLFHSMPFIGGTNMFIHHDLIENSEGFDNSILTEDIEIGVRLYTDLNQWPVFLPYPSTEQTPPTIKAYYRQRYRWGYGLMQTIKKLSLKLKDKNLEKEKRLRIKKMIISLTLHGPLDWVIYYPLAVSATLLFISRLFKTFFVSSILYRFASLTTIPWHPLNDVLSLIVMFVPIPILIFISILLKHYWSKINFSGISSQEIKKQLFKMGLFILFGAPLISSYYVFPYIRAFINYLKNPNRRAIWVKTKRTREALAQ